MSCCIRVWSMLLQWNFIFHFQKTKLSIHILPLQFHHKEYLTSTFHLETTSSEMVSDISATEIPLWAYKIHLHISVFAAWGMRFLTVNEVIDTWQCMVYKLGYLETLSTDLVPNSRAWFILKLGVFF